MPSFPKIKLEAQEIKSAAHFFLFLILLGLGWMDRQEQRFKDALRS